MSWTRVCLLFLLLFVKKMLLFGLTLYVLLGLVLIFFLFLFEVCLG
jgi:hypothetical protein